MSNTYVPVTPGIDMSKALGSGKKLSKKWLRDYLRDNPQKDFRNQSMMSGTYVNGQTCIEMGLTLNVVDPNYYSEHVAYVDFQPTDSNEWGYQAVVR